MAEATAGLTLDFILERVKSGELARMLHSNKELQKSCREILESKRAVHMFADEEDECMCQRRCVCGDPVCCDADESDDDDSSIRLTLPFYMYDRSPSEEARVKRRMINFFREYSSVTEERGGPLHWPVSDLQHIYRYIDDIRCVARLRAVSRRWDKEARAWMNQIRLIEEVVSDQQSPLEKATYHASLPNCWCDRWRCFDVVHITASEEQYKDEARNQVVLKFIQDFCPNVIGFRCRLETLPLIGPAYDYKLKLIDLSSDYEGTGFTYGTISEFRNFKELVRLPLRPKLCLSAAYRDEMESIKLLTDSSDGCKQSCFSKICDLSEGKDNTPQLRVLAGKNPQFSLEIQMVLNRSNHLGSFRFPHLMYYDGPLSGPVLSSLAKSSVLRVVRHWGPITDERRASLPVTLFKLLRQRKTKWQSLYHFELDLRVTTLSDDARKSLLICIGDLIVEMSQFLRIDRCTIGKRSIKLSTPDQRFQITDWLGKSDIIANKVIFQHNAFVFLSVAVTV